MARQSVNSLISQKKIDKMIETQENAGNIGNTLAGIRNSFPELPSELTAVPLEELVPVYGEINDFNNSLGAIVKRYNASIKDKMGALNLINFETESYVATLSASEKVAFIEDLLILKLREIEKSMGLDASKFIKTREYVDMEELERAMYSQELNPSDFIGCQTVTITSTLRVKKSKKKKAKEEDE